MKWTAVLKSNGSVAEVANAREWGGDCPVFSDGARVATALHAHRPGLNLSQRNRVLVFHMKS